MNLLAIDPGVSGGISYRIGGMEAQAMKMPETPPDVYHAIRRITQSSEAPFVCYIEDIPKYVGENVPSSAIGVMFQNFGYFLGVLQALQVKTILVTPQKWQKGLGLGTKGLQKAPRECSAEERARIRKYNEQAKRDWKAKLRGEAQRRFPHLSATLSTADSLLILEFARMCESGMSAQKIITPQPQPSLL